MSTTSAIFLASWLIGQVSFPDELDLLRSTNVKPQINLLLDQSCSMNLGIQPTACTWWAAQYNNGNVSLSKNQQMRAALVGCGSADDGLIHKWYPYVTFAIREFPARPICGAVPPAGCGAFPEWCPCNAQASSSGNNYPWGVQIAGFNASEPQLTAGAQSVGASGNTPMTLVMAQAAQDFNAYFDGSNTKSCRPNFNILLTDGNPNAAAATFDYACNGDSIGSVSSGQPWLGSNYNANEPDLLCRVPGNQSIKTYTIGFGTLSTFNPNNLQAIAAQGQGQYFYAADVQGLTAAFQTLVTGMVSNTVVFSANPAIQTQSLYSGNYAYVGPYRPIQTGRWRGNLKKLCVFPSLNNQTGKYDTSNNRCMFQSPDGTTLNTNPTATDTWTQTATNAADIGGSGLVMQNTLGAPGAPATAPYWPRNIVTWRGGDSNGGYVSVRPSTWSSADSWVIEGDRRSFINQLHGYSFESTNDTLGNPVHNGAWPYGDDIHAPIVTFRYDATPGVCETTAGKCFAVFGSNDGMLHFVDGYNGRETTALIPQEFWKPNNIASEGLFKAGNQPAVDPDRPIYAAPTPQSRFDWHRFYVDGGLRLLHEDRNGDGAIDLDASGQAEPAYLVFGLGRGGKAYYVIPMSRFNGVLSSTDNPVYPLTNNGTDALAQIRDTWASPWLGQLKLDRTYDVAAFASGHIGAFDQPMQTMPAQAPSPDRIDPISAPRLDTCANAARNGTILPSSCNFNGPYMMPLDVTAGPFTEPNAIAYQVHFATFDMDPNDTVWIQNSQGRVAAAVTSAGARAPAAPWSPGLTADGWSPWIFDTAFEVRVTTSGNGNPGNHLGYVMDQVRYLTRTAQPPSTHYPTVFIVDLAQWNHSGAPLAFTASPDAGGVLARFTSDCSAAGSAGGQCFDRNNFADLAHMTCPISAELSAITTGERLQSLYWGDECGQIWAARLIGTSWSVRRILNLNPGADTTNMSSTSKSKDYRKIFRRLDTVLSKCPGRAVTAVYFGTGDQQRPMALDELQGGLNTGADVMGVVWDDGVVANLTDRDLADATTVNTVDPRTTASKGWVIRLASAAGGARSSGERMLRNPFVFQGVAHFKTFTPVTQSLECQGGTGVDTIYTVNNCTAEATVDRNADGIKSYNERRVWNGQTNIGSDLVVLTPQYGRPVISSGNLLGRDKTLNPTATRLPRIFHWRFAEDY